MIRVLILEEHEMVRKALEARLRDIDGLEVNSLGRYTQAVQRARALHPEVILMEIKASEGFETLKTLRDAVPEAALIILTSYPDSSEEEKVLAAGASAYLLKTLDTRSLVAQIRTSAPSNPLR